MSGIMSALVGNSGGTNNFTVTVGVSGSGILTSYGYNGLGLSPYQPGAISPLSNVLVFAAAITSFYCLVETYPSSVVSVALSVNGDQRSASWNSVVINGNTFLKSAATANFGGGITTFQWSGLGNPFGTTSGAQIPAVFS